MDDTDLDIIVVDDEDGKPIGRPTVTFAFELTSRMPYGMAITFRRGSYLTIAACLLHGILPKPDYRAIYGLRNDWLVCGVPEEIIIDRGKHYIGKGLKDACAVLDIRITPLPRRTPWWKGHIERMFRTQNTGVIHSLPGTTKSNVVDRGDYKSQKNAFIRYSRFIQLLLMFLLDDYAIKEHRALRDTPMNVWNTGVLENAPFLGRSPEEVHRLLCRQTKRLIGRTGVSLEGLIYQSSELITLRTNMLRCPNSSL
jgi:putative transposase